MGRRVKTMAAALYGRLAAYETGEKAGDLAAALRRNLFGTVTPTAEQLGAMVRYTDAACAALAAQPLSGILAGRPDFPAWTA